MKLLKRLLSMVLIVVHVIVFCTCELLPAEETKEQDSGSQAAGIAESNIVGLVSVDICTGTASTSIPIFIPPGRKGLNPKVNLSYSSGGANGWCGVGWNLDFGSISRSTKRGQPLYTDADTFILGFGGGASELVSIGNNEYRMKHEALFMRINKEGGSWIVTDKSGTKYTFGSSNESRATNSKGTFSWHIDRAQDTNGNYMTYTYTHDAGSLYPHTIAYNGHAPTGFTPTHQVMFTLENRNDKTISFITGARVEQNKRLSEIGVEVSGQLSRRYEIMYGEYSSSTHRSLIRAIQEMGSDGVCTIPEVTVTYTSLDKKFAAITDFSNVENFGANTKNYVNYTDTIGSGHYCVRTSLIDINSDGVVDRVSKLSSGSTDLRVQLGNQAGNGFANSRNWGPVVLTGNQRFDLFEYYYNYGREEQKVKHFDMVLFVCRLRYGGHGGMNQRMIRH